jgi:hypothetical protein
MRKCSRLEERALRRAGLREKSLESDPVSEYKDEEYPLGPCAANLEYLARYRKED